MVGHFTGTEWTPPQGSVNFDDVMVGIMTFRDENADNAAHFAGVDVVPNLDGTHPNGCVCINDVYAIILAY